MATAFDWFTGEAKIDAACPDSLAAPSGFGRYFVNPNDPAWGPFVPRALYHEALHYWQFLSSSHLQSMVAAKWGRVLEFERTGHPPPLPAGAGYGAVVPGEPFSVRDLVECLARFWDVHTRGVTQILREEGDDLGGELAAIDAQRAVRQEDFYTGHEFDAVMVRGRDCQVYGAPYRWMVWRSIEGMGVPPASASWTANLLLPVLGFTALNTAAPVAAFSYAYEEFLGSKVLPDVYGGRSPRNSINLEWLRSWHWLTRLTLEVLRQHPDPILRPRMPYSQDRGLASHPVYQHLGRVLAEGFGHFAMLAAAAPANPPRDDDPEMPVEALFPALEARFLRQGIDERIPGLGCFALPGQPGFRMLLGRFFSPPLLRFADAELAAPDAAWRDGDGLDNPWPVNGAALTADVRGAAARVGALDAADFIVKHGLLPDAFAGRAAVPGPARRACKLLGVIRRPLQ